MCQFISFFHKQNESGDIDIAVNDLNSYGNTEQTLKLSLQLWHEGHYTPKEELILRYNGDKPENYDEHFRNRFPDFISFLNWCLMTVSKNGVYTGYLDLSSLTTLDPKVKLPNKISGSLYLSSLTTLDPKVKLPTECGSLDLSSLTTLDPKVKLPNKISGYLDLSSLTTLDPKVKLPNKISGSLDLSSLTTLDPKVKLPNKISGSLYLSSLTTLERDKVRKKYGK